MKDFIYTDEDNMTLEVIANYRNFEVSKEVYQNQEVNEPVCICIQNKEVNYAGLSIEKTKELISYLVKLVDYFEDKETIMIESIGNKPIKIIAESSSYSVPAKILFDNGDTKSVRIDVDLSALKFGIYES